MVDIGGAHDERAVTRDLATLPVQVRHADAQRAATRVFDLAVHVTQGSRRQLEIAAVDRDTPCSIIQLPRSSQLDSAIAAPRLDDAAASIVQISHLDIKLPCA